MKFLKRVLPLLAALALFAIQGTPDNCAAHEKIGVLVLGAGMDETYKPDWIPGYTGHFYPSFTPGMLTGGPLEGETCYTLIHYANEAEAAVCSQVRGQTIPEGTPIDIFCNEYNNTEQYPIHSIMSERLLGANGYLSSCYPGIIPYFIASGHSTIDPATGQAIIGPHINDPDGPGIGIADFQEMYAFYYMTYHYEFSSQDFRDPYRRQYLRYVFGNETPAIYGYAPDVEELVNLKDEVAKAIDNDTILVYRMGWEAYMHNRDIYGADTAIADSTETALRELIQDEKVDRIIVLGTGGHYSNVTNWGYCWRDSGGAGVSSIDNATYYECINNLNDGSGPNDRNQLMDLLSKKPWRQFEATYPVIHGMAKTLKPELEVTYANAFGDYPAFGQAVVEMLKYTSAKYSISPAASLKVILATHGYGKGYMTGAECDSYFNVAAAFAQRVMPPVESWLAQNWSGRHEVAHGENEFAEPTMEDSTADPPDRRNPRGKIIGTGEHIDIAINGSYVNGLGKAVDNGNANFDYVVVIPILWDAENVDTITDFREGTLGNHEYLNAGGGKAWIRQEHDSDGTAYSITEDFDSEFFTVKVMDASGWESTPKRAGLKKPSPVKKGSAEKPTSVILTGALLSLGNGPVRSNFVAAAAASILAAIADPAVGGYHDEACEMQALGMVINFEARSLLGAVQVSWTAMEGPPGGGFSLYRAAAEAGPYEKLDSAGIAEKIKRDGWVEYRYCDRPQERGTTWHYRLERSLDGATASYGPVSATL